MFILLGISSHLSKLLVVFTELIEVPKTKSSKYTVMGITSGKFSLTSYVFSLLIQFFRSAAYNNIWQSSGVQNHELNS